MRLLDVIISLLEPRLELGGEGIRCLFGQITALDQLFRVELAHGGAVLDLPVQDRLGVHRLIRLVVAVPAVADHVHHHVPVELLPESKRQFHCVDHGLRVVPVHVEDGRLDHLGHVGGIVAGVGLPGQGSEPDLVVDDQVNGPARGVPIELGEVQRLGHEALARKGGVPVDQQGQDLGPRFQVLALPLLGPCPSLDDRIDCLEMTRVRCEGDVNALAVGIHVVRGEAAMVLDVAVPPDRVGQKIPVELREELRVGLVEDVCQHVQPTPVCHAHDDLIHADPRSQLDQFTEARDQGLCALDGEPLLAQVSAVREVLEQLGIDQPPQDVHFSFPAERGPVAHRFHLGLKPPSDAHVLDVQVFDADRTAVGISQDGDDFPQFGPLGTSEMTGVEHPIQIRFGETEFLELELGVARTVVPQGVELGNDVSLVPVVVDQTGHLGLGARLV